MSTDWNAYIFEEKWQTIDTIETIFIGFLLLALWIGNLIATRKRKKDFMVNKCSKGE
jgi:hypothetical protein